MDTKVTQPFVMRLNREISRLLGEAGVKREGIAQVLCTGSHATLPTIQAWLQKQLPQARWVGPGAQANAMETGANAGFDAELDAGFDAEFDAEFVSHRIAYGLANLPVYAQVLDRPQQQYSDYFC
ncbi:MAG: hypothetical protein HC857_07960 [Synechococcales cyanobacterium RU_4_20]|nr:hypothetical protein [Synechococcales cyanobacterium RU_4_20]